MKASFTFSFLLLIFPAFGGTGGGTDTLLFYGVCISFMLLILLISQGRKYLSRQLPIWISSIKAYFLRKNSTEELEDLGDTDDHLKWLIPN